MTSDEAAFGGVIGRTYQESVPDWPAPARAPVGAPNLVFIVLDDVGFADLGCYGAEIETPNMDRLAASGLRYTNFHTTAMCSPTRASLLTGRNHHSVGMGIIADWSTGFPAFRGRVSKRAALLPEMLRPHGYNSFAVGKWHLAPLEHATPAGPFDYWPLQRGFDRWYGFYIGLTDHWHPELYEDNHAVETPTPPGYHLSEDLVDRSIQYVRDQQAVAAERPFFLYLAFGAAHWPHQVPREYIDKYRGRYDRGWDVIREERFARQQALGIVPPDTQLPPRNPDVKPWAELSVDEQRVFARLQEAYAGFIDHTDAQIGRLLDALERDGLRDNTLIVLISDNGASPEGNVGGSLNNRKHRTFEPDTFEEVLAGYDLIGSEKAYNHYPRGWAQASNTPLKWYKRDVHGGGIRDVCILSWPARIADPGGLRDQYHHVVDLTPTILELVGIEAPREHQGVPQMPIHGVSLAYTLDDPAAPTRKEVQYYELAGDRALWHRGWKAVALHSPGTDFEQDRWELYHVEQDFSESRDLAAERPDKLRELIERWWAEAGQYGVLPLDDREWARAAESAARRARQRYVYRPGMPWIEPLSSPDITDRSYTITAEVELPDGGADGVILSAGAWFGGHVLYVKDGRLHYEYVYTLGDRRTMTSSEPLPSGPCTLRYVFSRTGPRQGVGRLYVDEREVGSLELPRTWPLVGLTSGLRCGRDGGTPVSEAYQAPFPFSGRLERVVVELGEGGGPDPKTVERAALAAE